jgi:hypothetical protein
MIKQLAAYKEDLVNYQVSSSPASSLSLTHTLNRDSLFAAMRTSRYEGQPQPRSASKPKALTASNIGVGWGV